MEIKNIDKGIIDQLSPQGPRDEARRELRPRPEQDNNSREPAQAAAPRRAPPLIAALNRSLAQSGLAVASSDRASAVAQASPDNAANQAETATRQAERSAEALQAFMHALVKALDAANATETNPIATTSSVTSAPQGEDSGRSSSLVANAYEGLVSRLETLTRSINSSQVPAPGNKELAGLDSAFRDLRNLSAGSDSGSAPDLQTVLKNLIRNLQSTGDPTLASTGNVINTAA